MENAVNQKPRFKNKIKQVRENLQKKSKKQLYFFQNQLSKGVKTQVIFLTLITVITSFIFGILLIFFEARKNDGVHISLWEAMWQSFLHTIDTGAIQGETDFTFRAIALFITLIGVFIFSALISVLTTGLDKFFTNLRKGKTEIFDEDFTLILGWGPTIFKIIEEKVLANANQSGVIYENKNGHKRIKQKGNHIVIMAAKEKDSMDDEIAIKVNQKEILENIYSEFKNHRNRTEIVCRTGDPIDLTDLKLIKPHNARSIIILPTENANLTDSHVIKCALALRGLREDTSTTNRNLRCPIVSEIMSPDNIDVVKKAFEDKKNGNKETGNYYFVPANEWLSKITAQTGKQSGYSEVIEEILNYENNEIYFRPILKKQINPKNPVYRVEGEKSELIGATFKEVYFAAKNCTVIGIVKKTLPENLIEDKLKNEKNPKLILNPFAKIQNINDLEIEDGDELIVFQFDDDTSVFNFSQKLKQNTDSKKIDKGNESKEREILIIGWNARTKKIVSELYDYISPNSKVTILDESANEIKVRDLNVFLDKNNKKLDIPSFEYVDLKKINSTTDNYLNSVVRAETTDFEIIKKYYSGNLFSIIILGYDTTKNIQERDADTILTLLHLNNIETEIIKGKTKRQILEDQNTVAEIYHEKNRKIVALSNTCDYIISENILSSIMTQISEQPLIMGVYDEIFDSDGVEIYLRDIDKYFDFPKNNEIENQSVINKSFIDIMSRTLEEKEIVIGYRKKINNEKAELVINPKEKENLIEFKPKDELVVISLTNAK